MSVQTAVILAGGLGSRLKNKTKLKPKGFLELEDISLIQRSIDNLLSCGIKTIYIGTGYLSEVYENFAKNYKQIECIKSDKFETTSSMYTLYNMRNIIKNDFLLLESDLLYETKAITTLINETNKNIILASGETLSNDEVYIESSKTSELIAMSKNKNNLNSISGELVGISKVSISKYQDMCEAFLNQDNQKIDYEYIMVQTSKKEPFYIKKIDDLIWCEIDDSNHLKRAMEKILPKLKLLSENNST
jgi:2-aminoethylphosphonate-pyruvate transaminase